MTHPDRVETRNGQQLTARVWSMLDSVARQLGVTVYVSQGGYKNGGGASASGSTHDVGDVFDISCSRIPESKWVELNTALRSWNACAWVRSPAYGWTSTGPHIHGVMRDSVDGLSSGARSQVRDYDAGKNGLSGGGKDPFPRPVQRAYVMPGSSTPTPTPATRRTDDDMLLTYTGVPGKTTSWLLTGGKLTNVSSKDAATWTGARMTVSDPGTWDRLTKGYPTNRG